MKPTHTKLDSFEFGTVLLSWDKLAELQKLPGVERVHSYTSAVDHRTNIVEVEGTASGLRAVRANLGVSQKPKKPAKPAPSAHEQAIKDCHVLLDMIHSHLRRKDNKIDLLRAQNFRIRLSDLVVYLAQLNNGGSLTNGEANDNLDHYLSNRNKYRAMSLGWVCSKDFERL